MKHVYAPLVTPAPPSCLAGHGPVARLAAVLVLLASGLLAAPAALAASSIKLTWASATTTLTLAEQTVDGDGQLTVSVNGSGNLALTLGSGTFNAASTAAGGALAYGGATPAASSTATINLTSSSVSKLSIDLLAGTTSALTFTGVNKPTKLFAVDIKSGGTLTLNQLQVRDIVTAVVGSVGSTQTGSSNVTVPKLQLLGTNGIGTSANQLDTAAGNVELNTVTGDIQVANTGDVILGGVTTLPADFTTATTIGVQVKTSGAIGFSTTGTLFIQNINETFKAPGPITIVAGTGVLGKVMNKAADPIAVESTGGAVSITATTGNVQLGAIVASLKWYADIRGLGVTILAPQGSIVMDCWSYIFSTGGPVVLTAKTAVRFLKSGGNSGASILPMGVSPVTIEAATFELNSNGSVASSSADCTVTADEFVLVSPSQFKAPSNFTLWVKPRTAGRPIDLGLGTATGALGITAAELALMTGGTVRIGGPDAGALSVTAAVARSGASKLRLDSGVSVTQAANATITDGTGSTSGYLLVSSPNATLDQANVAPTQTQLLDGLLKLSRPAGLALSGGLVVGDGIGNAGSAVARLSYADQFLATKVLMVYDDGLFDMNGFNQTVAGLSGTGTTSTGQIALGSATLTSTHATNNTYSGSITGTGSYVKQGIGTQTLNGSGTVKASITAGTLGGRGSLGAVTVTAATVAPGLLAPGILTGIFTFGSLTLDGTSAVKLDVNGAATPVAGTHYDQVVIGSGGSVNLGGAALTLVAGASAFVASAEYTLIKNNGSNAVVGTFAGRPEGATVTLGGVGYTLSYVGGDGNDVVLKNTVAAPTVAAITPTSGPTGGGTSVTITGTNLAGASAVTIGGAACTALSGNTATSITCTTPAGTAGARDVVVTTPGGGSATGSGLFTYLASISPSTQTLSGTAGTAMTPSAALTPIGFGGVVTYAISPSLPTGLSLNSGTGVISGTPAASQASTPYTITGTGATSGTATTAVSLAVTGAPALAPLSQSATGTVGSALTSTTEFTPSGFGGTVSYAVSPALPGGLSLSATTGVISGTPGTAQLATTYTVTGTGSTSGSATATVSLTVNPSITPASQAVTGTRYLPITPSAPLSPAGFPSTVSYSVAPALPDGLALNGTSGVLSGAPRAALAGTSYTITGSDGTFSATASVTLTVGSSAAPAPLPSSQARTGPVGTPITPTQAYTGVSFNAGAVYGEVSLYAGLAGTSGTAGAVNGYRLGTASFSAPQGVSMDPQGNLYVTDSANDAVRRIDLLGAVSTFASGDPVVSPSGIASDASGNLYVTSNHRVLKITAGGTVSVLAGSGTAGFANGTGTAAQFSSPSGIAISADHATLYVADGGNRRIRSIAIGSGVVGTFAGTGTKGNANGPAITTATFDTPAGVAVTASGIVYVSDAGNHLLRKIASDLVSTLAGNGAAASIDGLGALATFNAPAGLALDGADNIYLAESVGNRIRKITPAGLVSTLAGSGTAGAAGGVGIAASFAAPRGLYFDPVGYLYVADSTYNKVRQVGMTGFGVSPPLPAGLGLASDTGVVSGAPSQGSPAGGALAEYYTNDFSVGLKGAVVTGNAGIVGGQLVLTPNTTNQSGTFTVPASGINAQAYRTSFKLVVGNPASGADGCSYSFTNDAGTYSWGNEVGFGSQLSLSFDLYESAPGSEYGSKGIRLMYGPNKTGGPSNVPGKTGVLAYSSDMSWANAGGVSVVVEIDAQGLLTLTVGGTKIFDQLQLPPEYLVADRSDWAHVFAARTGLSYSLHALDDLTIQQSGSGAASYQVTGYNYDGRGAATVSLALGNLPGAPTSLVATPGSGQASVSFTPPTPSTGLSYQYSLDGGANWISGGSSSPITITGLTNGSTYVITIRAVNNIGAGPGAAISTIPRGAPAAPTALDATPGNGRATIAFTAGSDNGSPITGYDYSLNAGGSWTSAGVIDSPATVTGLTNGTSYSITLRAVNAVGNGAASGAVAVTPVASPPGAPANVGTSVNVNNITVTWTAPSNDGGSAVTGYTVGMSTDPATVPYAAPAGCTATTTSTATTCTATGLSTGTYYFRVSAINVVGSGPWAYAGSGATIPSLVPAAPTGLVSTPGDKKAIVTFIPGADHGLAISGYEYSINGGTTWASAGVAASPITITGLTNGTAYGSIKIRAVNAAGAGASAAAPSVTPATLPGAPVITGTTAGNASATIAFTAGSTGGSAISNYQYSTNGGTSWAAFSPAVTGSPVTVTGLTNGTTYSLELRAVNAVGAGPGAATSVIPRGVPDAPTGVSGQGGNTQVIVSWTAPASNGGSEITGYSVTTITSARTCTATGTTSCVVTGLTNGTAYTFTVKATNAAGTGAASTASGPVTPATVPAAPTAVTAAAGNAQATVSWTAPNNGGAAISRYNVAAVEDSGKGCVASSGTSCTVTGLGNGTAYTFVVNATNSTGTGADSVPSAPATPKTTPGAPLAVSALAGNAKVTVSWTAPASNGGSAITGYSVAGTPGGSCSTTGATTCTVSPLANGTSYTFAVTATNAAGTGPSASAAATPALPALTPSSQTITATAGTAMTPTAALTPNSSFVGTVTYGIAPTVPGGLSFNGSTGVVSGTPAAAQTSTGYTITGTGATSGTATATLAIAIGPSTQGVLVLSAAPNPIHVNRTSLLSTSGGSGSGAVSYAVANGDPCTIGGSTLTGTGAGSCSVTATKAADGTYGAATSSPVAITVALGPQGALVALASPTSITVHGTSSLSSAGGSGGGAVTYAVASGDPCTVSGSTLTGTGAGSCTVTATKAADAVYAAATSDPVTVSVSRGAQSALFVTASPTTISVHGASTLSSSGGSGEGAVSYALVSGPCTLVGNQLTGTGVGTCSVTASKAESVAYSAATSSPIGVIVGLSAQSALWVLADPTTIKTGEWSQLTTTGGSGGGAVTYQVLSGPCTLDGTRLTSASADSCSVSASKAADGNYASVTSAPMTVTVGLSPQSALSVLAAPSTIAVNDVSTLSSTGGSGTGAVTYALVSGPCSLEGESLTGTGAGSCSVTASKAADLAYAEATSNPITVTIGLAPQSTLSVSAAPTSISVNGTSALSATGGSGTGSVTYSLLDGPCSLAGSTLTGTGSGSCRVRATKAADTAYAEAVSAALTLTVDLAPQSSLALLATPSAVNVGDASVLGVTGGSGSGSVTYALVGGPCSLSGSTLSGIGAGSCVVTASKGADSVYAATTSSPVTLAVGLAPQSALTGLADPSTTTVLGASSLSATGGSGTGALTFVLLGGPCSISGEILSGLAAGSCSVSATKAEDSTYAAATSAPFAVTVGLAPQSALELLANPSTLTVHGVSQLGGTGGSGTGSLSYSLLSGPCSLSGSALTGLGAGSCAVTVSKAADATYAVATSEAKTVVVGLAAQTPLSVSAAPAAITVNASSTLTTGGGSGTGAVSYQLLSGPCSISGQTLAGLGEGGCTVVARKAADAAYAETTSGSIVVTVGLSAQSPLSVLADPTSISPGSRSALGTSGGSGTGLVTYSLLGPCSLSGSTLTGIAAGSCSVAATKEADASYAATTSAALPVTVGLIPQPTLTLTADPATIVVTGSSTLSTSGGAGSGLVSYSVVSGPCSVSGSTLTGTGTGSCSVTATKAADTTYASATSAPVTVTVGLAPQATLVLQAAPTSINVGATSVLSTTGGSGTGAVTYQVVSGPCTVSGSTLTGTGAGGCSVTATKTADTTYASATSAPVTVTVGLAPQATLVLQATPTSINVGAASVLSTTGGSGTGAVTYQVVSGPCTVSGSTLTGTGAGGCSVTATKAADTTYASATSAPVTVTVGLAPQSALTLLAAPTTVNVTGTSALSTAGGSGTGTVSYQLVSGPCTVSGSTLTGSSAGSCSVTATKAADTRYASATSAPVTVTVSLAPQSALSVRAVPSSITVGGSSTLESSGGSGTGTETYALLDGPCTLSGATLTGTSAGSCSVTATKAADATYASATSAPVTVTVGLAPQSALTLLASPTTIDVNGTSALATTGGSGTGTVTYALVGGPCSLSGSTLTGLQRGSCSVTATKAADATYASATSAAVTVTVELAPQVPLALVASPTTIPAAGNSTLATTGGSGTGAVTFALADGPCTLSGATLTGMRKGSCSVTATKAADATYAQATSLAATVTVELAPQSPLAVHVDPSTINVGFDAALSTTGGSGTGRVVYTLANGPCGLSGSTLTGLGSGSCSVTATREADDVYAMVTSAPVTVPVGLSLQSPLALLADPSTVSVTGTGALVATGGSGTGAVTYALVGGPCTLSGATFTGIAAGSCSFTATKAADVAYAATTSGPITITVGLNPQSTLTLLASPGQIAANGTSALTTSGGSGSGAVTFSLVGGPCSLSGSTLTGLQGGTCTVSATKAADTAYAEAAAAPSTVTVNLAPQQALTASANPASIAVLGTSSLGSSGGSGTGVVTFTLAGGPCSLSGSTLTGLAAGSCVFTATKVADATYAQATSAPATVTVALSTQATLVLAATPSSIPALSSALLTTTGGSGTGVVTFALSSGSCSLSGNRLTGLSAGTCSVTATKAADTTYAPAISAPVTVTVGLAPQATLLLQATPTSINVGATSALSTTGGSGAGAVTYQVVSGPCTVSGSTLTGTVAGGCSVTATKAADTTYSSATSAPVTVTVGLAPQSPLTLQAAPTTVNVGATSALSNAGGSGTGAVTYQVVSGPCTVSGSTLTGTGAGSCSVTATKAADTTYASATSAPVTVTVGLAPQSPLTLLASPTTVDVNGTSALTTTGGSGTGAVTYALLNGPCSLSGSTLTGLQRGSCSVTATKAADASYAQATSSAVPVTVALAPQVPLALAPSPAMILAGGTSALATTGGSGTGAVTYTLLSGPCTLSGASLTGLRKGSCSVTATKAADATYAQATSLPATVNVELAPQSPLSVQADPSSISVGSDAALSTTGGSGTGRLVYALLGGPCRLSGSTLNGLGAGSCSVTATKAADDVYAQATSAPATVTVGLSQQSPLSLLADPSTVSVHGTGTLVATGGSGTGAVTYSLAGGPCTLSGATFSGIAAGSCTFTTTKAADVAYAAATGGPVTVNVGLNQQQSLTLQAAPTTVNVSGSSALSTTGGGGTGGVSYQVVSGPCSVVGSTLTGTGVGSCSVTASKAADATYASAVSARVTVTVVLAPQSPLTLQAAPTTVSVGGSSALSAEGGSGTGAVTYQMVSGPCSLSGSSLTGSAAGSCSVTATKAADATYASATSPPVTVTVGLAPQSSLALLATPTTVWVNATSTLATTGGSGTGAVTFSLIVGSCSLSGSTLTGLQRGSCSVTATKAADVAYAQATSAAVTVTVELAPQMPLAVVPSPTRIAAGETSTLATTGGSGTGAVTYALVDGPCTLSGATLTALQKGSCWVTGTKAADATYAQITSAPATVAVELIPQTPLAARSDPSMLILGPGTARAGQGGTGSEGVLRANVGIDGALAVTGGSGTGRVVYALLGGPCRLTGTTITGLDRGSCTVAATREADEVFARVTSEPVIVTVGLVPQSALALLADPSTVAVHGTGTLISTGGSGTGAVSYALVGGPCALSGATFTGIAAGSCSFTATKAADVTYATATSKPITITVGQNPQATLTLLASSGRIEANGTSALSTTGGSGSGVVSFSLIGGSCSLSGSTLTGLRAGPCAVSATKAADAGYAEASSAPATVTVILAPQQALAASASPASIPVAGTSSLGSSGGSGGGAVTFSLAGGPCSLSGSTLTGLAAGSCVFTATKAEDAAYTQATSAPATVNVALSTQATLVLTATPSTIPVLSSALLTTTGGSGGGLVTFSLTSGSCSIAGNRLTGLSAGSCVVTAGKAANGGYASATSSPITVTVRVGTASQLAFTTNPSATATAGTAWAEQPVVTAQDASGNTDPSYTTPVTLAIATGSGTLTCTTNPVTPVAGVATFSGCKVDAAGTVTLKATSGSITNTTTNPSVLILGTSIPTLGALGMIGLGVLLGLAGIVVLRRLA